MKVVAIDDQYVIYPDSVKTYDSLPAKCFTVSFDKMTGFRLIEHENLTVTEKVYGNHQKKVEKILKSFDRSNRSLGAIASGKKGIGKSLLFRLLSMECIKRGMPVIIVDRYYPGISNYLESITQEVMVLFDEFDKTFAGVKQKDGDAGAQTEMLGLFDGIATGKKLFVITCNDIYQISDFLVNRPGRFHYHFRFDVPSVEEIREFMRDKLETSDWTETQINEIVQFSRKVPLNYDCLRAIAFELQTGEPFKEAIKDLNILKNDTIYYNLMLKFTDGSVLTTQARGIDMFSPDQVAEWLEDSKGYDFVRVVFNTSDAVYDTTANEYRVTGDKLKFSYDTDEDSDIQRAVAEYKKKTPEFLSIKMNASKNLHYIL